MRTLLLTFVGLFATCAMSSLFAQANSKVSMFHRPLEFTHLSTDQGLSQNEVFDAIQDRKGFLWFATGDGLSRYDGYQFTLYKHDPLDSMSLSHNYILALCEDHNGMLWIGTRGGGLNRFDPRSQKFTRFTADPLKKGALRDNRIWHLYRNRRNELWIGTATGGLHRFNFGDETFDIFRNDPENPSSLSHDGVGAILESRDGTMWFGTERGGLNRFDRDNGTFKAYRHNPDDPKSIGSNNIWYLAEDSTGTLWVGTVQGGLNSFDRGTEIFTRFLPQPGEPGSIPSNLIRVVYCDAGNNLWIGTYGEGLAWLNPDRRIFSAIRHNPNDPASLINNHVVHIFRDRSGVFWIGTRYGGISRTKSYKRFSLYRNFDSPIDGETDNNIWAVYADQDLAGSQKLWIGTRSSGLYLVNKDNGKVVQYEHEPGNPASLNSNHITFITKGLHGKLWIGSYEGLNRYDPGTDRFESIFKGQQPAQGLKYNYISFILEDTLGKDRVLWLGTRGGGIIQLNLNTDNTKYFRYSNEREQTTEDYIFCIVKDIFEDKKILWLATYGGGLLRFHPETEQFYAYRFDENNPQSLSNNFVLSICKTRHGDYWIGTTDGLNHFDPATGVFERFFESDGLPNATIYTMQEDEEGYLWIATNAGISKFNPAENKFRNYDVHDGLQANQFTFNSGAYFKSDNGEFFFGGIKGLTSFFPHEIRDNNRMPPIVITDFKVHNRSVPVSDTPSAHSKDDSQKDFSLPSHISETVKIILPYHANIFTFEFAALDYNVPEKNRYAYMLEGFDTDWNHVGNQRTATYTNIDPGEYVFRVKGTNNDGLWNETGASIHIIITPPWWKTWWAYLLYFTAGAAMLFFGRHYELNRQRLKHDLEIEHLQAEKLGEIDRLKSRFFANISHEFRTPLTLIKGPIEKMLAKTADEENRRDLQLVRKNCQRLLELINQLLDLSRLESGRMRLRAEERELVAMLRGMTMAFESLADLRGLNLTFSSTSDNIHAWVECDKLEKIITNLLSNAIKFTPVGGRIDVQVSLDPTQPPTSTGSVQRYIKVESPDSPLTKEKRGVTIAVSDTGIGIPAEQLDNIFDRFYQADDSATRSYGGTGIGLALVKELMELHHGTISVSSVVNEGTRFTIRLPLGSDHLSPEEMVDANQSADVSGTPPEEMYSPALAEVIEPRDAGEKQTQQAANARRKKSAKILIVEDNDDVRSYICDSLRENYQTLSAENGKQGLVQALKTMPDLIVSDVMMPEMDGFALCEKLKTDERTSHIPVILLTARASDENKLIGLETGADDYLTKPFSAPELRARIKNLIEQRRRLQERFQEQIKLEPGEVTVTSMDKKFLQKAIDLIEQHMADSDFSAELLSSEMAMHRVHLNRKIKAITGLTTTLFIRSIRLKRAAQLLTHKSGNITEIAYDTGFSNPAYFANCFREEFGVSPREFIEQHTGTLD